ncbi:hypothetical protein JW933_05395 [candidate division FCPU426 bacterium]|nr:hypothetical protein [candidate division FCPU426 bacterium]
MKPFARKAYKRNLHLPLTKKNLRAVFGIMALALLLSPASGSAKEFVDKLTTDFYAGREDNIVIGQNLDGDLQLALYSQLGSWTTTNGPSNTSLFWSSVTLYNGKAYLSGGKGSSETKSFGGPEVANATNKIWYGTILSDGSVDEWKEVEDTSRLPQPTFGHSSQVVNGRLYIIGGRTTADLTLSAVYWGQVLGHDGTIKAQYKPNTWTAVSSLPQALFRAKSLFYEGRIYVVGGQDSADIAQNTVYYAMVEPNGDIHGWTETSAPLPINISGHCAAISNGRIYVIGGSITGEALDAVPDVYIGNIDPVTGDINSWVQTTSLPEIRYGADATIACGKLWVAGGWNSGTAKADVFYARLNPNDGTIPPPGGRDTWSRATDIPIPVYDHNFVAFNGHLLLIGGRNSTGIQNLVYVSTLATPKTNITRWVPTTPLFMSAYGGSIYSVWTGHSAELRVPLPGDNTGLSSGTQVFIIGGGPNTYVAYAGGSITLGTGYNAVAPAAYSTIYNSEVDSDGNLKNWAAPDTGGSIPIASFLHKSTIANGAIYVVGGANSTNAYIWAGAASRSIAAYGQADVLGRPCMLGRTDVLYEEVGQGGSSGGTGSFEYTAPVPIFDPAYEYDVYGTVRGVPWPTDPANPGVYDAITATPIYQPLMRHAVVSHNGNVYVIGGVSRENQGWDANGEPTTGSVRYYEDRVWFCRPNPGGSVNYSVNAGGWKMTASLPMGLYDLAACVAYGRIYVFGGRISSGVPQNIGYYAAINNDGTIQTWIPLTAPMPEALAEHQVVFMNGRFYMIGGINATGLLRNTVYYCTLDPNTGQIPTFPAPGSWEFSNTTLEYPVAGHSSLANNGFLYVLGGRYNSGDPHTSSAYMTSVIDMYQSQDIVYAWAGTFERYVDLSRDQLIQNVNWDGNPNLEILRVKCRYALDNGQWSDWTLEQTVGPFVVQRFARYLHYKLGFETRTNEHGNVYRTPLITRVYVDYAESKFVENDGFQVNHNKFDPQVEQLLITYKTRDHAVNSVIIRVYNLEGELIRRQDIDIPAGTVLPATGSWIWDGTNENNELVANGVYAIQYNSGNTHKLRKVVVFKQ